MQTGTIISGVAHSGLILLALLGGLDWGHPVPPPLRLTKVTLVRAADLAVQSSAAPQVPMAQIDQIAQPEIPADSAPTPRLETAITQSQPGQAPAPAVADSAPDVSALLRPDTPDVVVQAPTVNSLSPQADSAPDMAHPALHGNELNAPASMNAPPPRSVPRIDTTAAVRPPKLATPDAAAAPEVSNQPGKSVDAPVQQATAPPEATTQITPDGQKTAKISGFAPQTASRPPRRPARGGTAASVAAARAPANPDIANAVAAALQAAQTASQTAPPVVATLSGPQKAVIGDVVSQKWNKVSLTGVPNFEQYVVRVAVNVSATGVVDEASVVPVEPANPTGYFANAYRAARSAIIQAGRAGGIPLPEGKFPDGVRLVLRFDPASGEIGFN